MSTLLDKYLKALKVPHTPTYADSVFNAMPFKNLFGLKRALEEFGVESRGLKFQEKSEIINLPTPYLAQIHGGVVIVTKVSVKDEVTTVTYQSTQLDRNVDLIEFLTSFTGITLQSVAEKGASEKDLNLHRFVEFADRVKMPILVTLLTLLAVYGSIRSGLWNNVWKSLVFGIDIIGVAVCYLLWLKTNGVKSKVADSMCRLTTEHGCDKVLDTRLSSFMGIFKWSEVGMGYFAISLMTLILFPDQWSNLALFNVCCLPYTIWSIATQKFVIKAWCTLCLIVQSILWCLFLCYLFGGAWPGLSISINTFVLLGCYICGVLLMNLVNMFIAKAK